LATKGVAVLRYEKRTKEHADKFKAKGLGQLTVKEEIIDDALSAVAQLRATEGLDPKRIFVLGHSLGGMVTPRIGQADPQIAGLIMLAGCLSRPLEDVMVEQARYVLSLKAKSSAEEEAWLAEVESTGARVKKLTAADVSSSTLLMGAPPAYWLDLRQHDPLATAKGLKQPLLILQGGRDYQATPVDFGHWKEALGAQPKVTFKLYPKLNHQFIAGEGKSTPDEYAQPGHVEETVVADIAEWIRGR
jgi:dienelactone hydrolase